MKIKTSELTGAALDWAVAKCEWELGRCGYYIHESNGAFMLEYGEDSITYSPSTQWSQGGPIIDREKIAVRWLESEKDWEANVRGGFFEQYGPAPLIAAMRCMVFSKLGDTIEIPEEMT